MTHAGATTNGGGHPDGLMGELRSFVDTLRSDPRGPRAVAEQYLPVALTAVAFVVLYSEPLRLLFRDWWENPEAGHGLLLAPVSIWLAFRSGIRKDAEPNHALGIVVLVLAVLLRYVSGLAAEMFTMRGSIILALAGLTIYNYGFRQVIHWWLSFILGALSIPLPELFTSGMALPLQFRASKMGAGLLEWRGIPVRLQGNVIRIPGNELFVTEACSGLRSLTALMSLAVLLGGLVLRTPVSRLALVALAVPIAVVINGIRVFLTGFLVYFVSPEFGKGFMHATEGWLLFLVSLMCMGVVAWVCGGAEQWYDRRKAGPVEADAGEAYEGEAYAAESHAGDDAHKFVEEDRHE